MATIVELVREAYSHWGDAGALSRTGRELHDRNRLDLARDVLSRALELDSGDTDAWEHLAFVGLRGFRPEEGFETLRKGIEATGSDGLRATLAGFTPDSEEREALLEQLSGSDDPKIKAGVASVRLWSRNDKGAFDEMRKLHQEHPEELDASWLWTLLGARARGMATDIDLRESGVPITDKKIAEKPDRVFSYWMKAQLLIAEKDWDALLVATDAALERFPDEETMMFFRGRALEEKGDLDRAAQCFSRAIGTKPSYAGARDELGKVYEAQGKLELAEEIFREIAVANPEYAGGQVSVALFLARQERWDEAETLFLEAWPKLRPLQKERLGKLPDVEALMGRERVKAGLEPASRG